MSNLREVNNDILKDWLLFREDELSSLTCPEDKKHWVYFDEISNKILNNIPKQNRHYVQKQLNMLDDNFLDYLGYWNEKYYRNGFCDGVQLLLGCKKNKKINPRRNLFLLGNVFLYIYK